MRLEAVASSPIGQLVPITGFDTRRGKSFEHFAYLPHVLPEDVDLGQDTWKAVVSATSAVARLDQAGALIPNPYLLRRPILRREAVSTSALEGTHAAFTDILEADISEARPQSAEVHEVLNYVVAAEHAIDSFRNRDRLSISLLAEAHETLVRGTSSDGPDAGRLRTTQVLIGPTGCTVDEARFIPPPADDRLKSGADQWEVWVNTPHDLPAVVQAALAHYQFETLHPFHDGNGRIGRLGILLHFMHLGELREPLLEVSPWFEARRVEYQDHLLQVSCTGSWDPWVKFFARGITAQAVRTVQRIDDLLTYQRKTKEQLRAANVRGVAMDMAEQLIGVPYLTPTWAAKEHHVTYVAANSAIARLTGLGLLREVSGRTHSRMFSAPEVLKILWT